MAGIEDQEFFIVELPRSCLRKIIMLLDDDVSYEPTDESKYALWTLQMQTTINITLKNSLSKLAPQLPSIVDSGDLWTPPNSTD